MLNDKAIEIEPQYAEAWYDNSFALKTLGLLKATCLSRAAPMLASLAAVGAV
jgi:hypothetical protein